VQGKTTMYGTSV